LPDNRLEGADMNGSWYTRGRHAGLRTLLALLLGLPLAGCGGGGGGAGGAGVSQVRFENFTAFTVYLFVGLSASTVLDPGESAVFELESNVSHYWQALDGGAVGPIIDSGSVRPDGPAVIFIDGVQRKPSPRARTLSLVAIFLDPETCPGLHEALEVARQHETTTHVLAGNTLLRAADDSVQYLTVRREVGTERQILERLRAGDIVVTADGAFAADCAAAGARVLRPDGTDWAEPDAGEVWECATFLQRLTSAVLGD
jgi:uncharacterized protein YaiI (UPF0178 family)